ncbi:atypical kinase COQ8B, mitochondrial isoform X2 [Onthophagus taurus]|uniref:atypical kinase COQ8B, mitochondrial isoform X2 n=1 Tax=Onthophagus taurus TaxID=166361 RepID=UPI000C208A69|nr:atypical kinase COQ8B, mitochondrial isoform X2 [Onthophagus taurus]
MAVILVLNTAMSRRSKDLFGVLRGVQSVIEAGVKLQEEELKYIWKHSSIKNLIQDVSKNVNKASPKSSEDIVKNFNETIERFSTVAYGIREYINYTPTSAATVNEGEEKYEKKVENNLTKEKDKSEVKEKRFKIKLTPRDKALLKKLDMEHRKKMEKLMKDKKDETTQEAKKDSTIEDKVEEKITASPNPKSFQTLSPSSKQRSVPSSRIGRMVSFGSLAAGLGLGTIAEYTRRSLGMGNQNQSNLFLTEANMERIVDTLCKVRGAALKIGQILSIQDDSVINPQLAKALERVRKSADFMPQWQLEKVLTLELGDEWRSKFAEFNDKPFAAASIGQVHWGKMPDGREVAIKIQYPGVAKGIESDIDNLFGVLKLWNIFPEGMFVDNLVMVAKRELAWEVDYEREAKCTEKFKDLLKPYPDYFVPDVIEDVSTKQVFTTEMLEGVPVDQCKDMSQEDRDFIATKILELILRELFEFRYMQTDPNWANFLYDAKNKKLLLLDFGASREYSKEFIDRYIKIIKAAADDDRQSVLQGSRDIGFLTGYETKSMENAHVDAVMILGEIFRCEGNYDFAQHNTTERLQSLVPTIVSQRLCPPPEEIYSLHRKLSGIFMLCSKLKAHVPSRNLFLQFYEHYMKNNH